MIAALALLVLLACLSPTLTLLRLWQIKEWRFDRLREHLRNEGMIRQLFGALRLKILGVWMVITLASFLFRDPVFVAMQMTLGLLLILAVLSCIQIAMRRQPIPVFTAKTMMMLNMSMLLTLAPLPWLLKHPTLFLLTALLPFFCPLWITLSWLLLQPLDAFLKDRVMKRAMNLRALHGNITVIGITGSVGKTTTKELLACILRNRGALATPVHVNTEMGVALWLTRVLQDKPTDWKGILIVEMGAYRRGEIRLLADIVKPQLGIITFVGSQHLSLFGSLEAIREAKGELFTSLPENGHAFMNHDNVASAPLRMFCRCPVTTVGTDGKADLCAFDIEETSAQTRPARTLSGWSDGGGGIRFTLQKISFLVPVAGTHTVTSILLAIAVARTLGMDLQSIATELRKFKPVAGTFEVKTIRGVTVLDDTYNSSPDSFRAAIAWTKAQPHGEKILLIDGIIELGTSEAAVHAKLAKESSAVFNGVCVANARFLPYFKENGFGERATLLSSRPARVNAGSLLVCVGRVPKTAIDELLPTT